MAYTNSPLVKATYYSPNHSGLRTHAIDTITIHMVVGQCTMASLGAIFAPVARQASSNYGVCTDGIALFVDEKNRSWCSSSPANDQRAITIETASDTFYPYAVRDDVYNNLIKLCADICKRNGKTKMVWCGSLAATNARTFASNEMRMTLHKWFDATSCPGYYLESRMQDIANKVNALLTPIVYPATPFTVTVKIADLNVRSAAAIKDGNEIGTAKKGSHTITKVKNDFGYSEKAAGWIYLANVDYVTIGKHIEEEKEVSPFKDMKTTDAHYAQVKALYDAGIYKTTSKGNIKPDATVSRAVLAVYLYRIMKKAKLL